MFKYTQNLTKLNHLFSFEYVFTYESVHDKPKDTRQDFFLKERIKDKTNKKPF